MKTVRIGYIGAGGFTNRFMYPQLARHDVALEAVCDLDESRAVAARDKYGFKQVFTDFHKMLDTVELDAVFCVGGPKVHYEVGSQVLERGFPLYIQKAPAPSAAETREMVALAERHRVPCHVGFNIRSAVAVRRAKQYLEEDEFGRPTLGIFRYGFVSGATVAEAIMDQHPHLFDTARYLLGDVADIQVRPGTMEGVRHYVATAAFAAGAIATFNFTSEQGGREFVYFEVTGEKGHLMTCHQFELKYWNAAVPANEHGVEIRTVDAGGMNLFGGEDPLLWGGYIADVANYLDVVRGVAEDRSPIASTVGTMEVAEEVCRQLGV